MMFLKFWIVWAFIGLSFATWLFWWSMKARQFDDSRRAAFLPLDDVDTKAEEPEPVGPGGLLNLYLLLGIAGLGLAMIVLTVILAVVL